MRTAGDGPVVVKEAESSAERARLGTEAALLRAAAHPGVVRLAGLEGDGAPDRPDRLLLHRIAGTDLAALGPQPAAVVAGWGAAVATVLADLHDLGLVHGDIRAEHVVIDEQGRPVLCGFGSARRVAREERSGPFDTDVRALAALIAERLPAGEVALRRTLARWGGGRRAHRSGARALARILVQRVPAARIGGEDGIGGKDGIGAEARIGAQGAAAAAVTGPPATEPVDVRKARAAGWLAALDRRSAGLGFLAAAAVGVGAAVAVSALGKPAAGGTRRGLASPVPAFVLEAAPDEAPVTVVGHWGCGAARPAVLDATSGSIWVFPEWPAAGSTASGKLVGRIEAARGLAVVSERPGCDRLLVLRAGSPDLPLAVPAGR